MLDAWDYGKWADLHRKEWTWDKVTWGTHLVDCYPGNGPWRVYAKDGVVIREEQAAKYPIVDSTGPDLQSPGLAQAGFQKGAEDPEVAQRDRKNPNQPGRLFFSPPNSL